MVDPQLISNDPHFSNGCSSCHEGDPAGREKETAHRGLVKRPSDNPETCGACHTDIAATYRLSLHYTTAGLKNGVRPRMSEAETARFDTTVFEQSCRSCHASCGDCHVKSPIISGVNTGLIDNHRFTRRAEAETCALCHGGRVYPEFTGEYGGQPDVHYQKGMLCMDCHDIVEFHGDGTAYPSRRDVAGKPACISCHPKGNESTPKGREAHADHIGYVSCSACHVAAPYRNCSSCHLGEGATSSPALYIGRNPRNPREVTTLRLIPTVRDTFAKAGIAMEQYDALPNFWDTVPHNSRKRTDRTRECSACHGPDNHFLKESMIPPGSSEANKRLILH